MIPQGNDLLMRQPGIRKSDAVLQKSDLSFLTSLNDVVGPDGAVHFADMCFPQEEHTDSGLADPSADGEGKPVFQDGFLERKQCALGAACFFKLRAQCLGIDADPHGGELERDVEYGIVDEDIRIELPVIVVGRTAVVGLSGGEFVTDLHQAYSALFAADQVLPLLGSLSGVEGLQLGGRDEENIVGQDLLDIVIADGHVFLGLAQHSVDILDDGPERLHIAVFPADDLFPIPLIHVDGVDIVGLFVAADRDHIRVESFTHGKTVFIQGIAFPFGEGVDDFRHLAGFLDIEGNRPLHAVQVVVEPGFGADEQRSGDAAEIQPFRKEILEEVLDSLNCDLGLVKIQGGDVLIGDD